VCSVKQLLLRTIGKGGTICFRAIHHRLFAKSKWFLLRMHHLFVMCFCSWYHQEWKVPPHTLILSYPCYLLRLITWKSDCLWLPSLAFNKNFRQVLFPSQSITLKWPWEKDQPPGVYETMWPILDTALHTKPPALSQQLPDLRPSQTIQFCSSHLKLHVATWIKV
jgi:hypothetical protein